MTIRVLVGIGTRPEAVKLAPVVRALAQHRPTIEPIVCAIAQHREMLDEVLSLFGIVPEHDLDVMREGQDLTAVTTRVLERFGQLVDRTSPQLVVVQGDTAAAMAAALAAFYRRTPVGHVEAGLRTDDPYSPYPEEMMRRMISRIATVHFAATDAAARRLVDERVPAADVFLTGNPVVDAVLEIRQRSVSSIGEGRRRLILVTAHRRERARLANVPRIELVPPLPYDSFIATMDRSYLVISDSGGVQEEAPVLGKPVLVMRENTERPEGLAANATMLVGTDPDRIVREAERLLRDPAHYAAMARPRSPFGDGKAATRIADVIREIFAHEGDGAARSRYGA